MSPERRKPRMRLLSDLTGEMLRDTVFDEDHPMTGPAPPQNSLQNRAQQQVFKDRWVETIDSPLLGAQEEADDNITKGE